MDFFPKRLAQAKLQRARLIGQSGDPALDRRFSRLWGDCRNASLGD
jgi:hypothetical protein